MKLERSGDIMCNKYTHRSLGSRYGQRQQHQQHQLTFTSRPPRMFVPDSWCEPAAPETSTFKSARVASHGFTRHAIRAFLRKKEKSGKMKKAGKRDKNCSVGEMTYSWACSRPVAAPLQLGFRLSAAPLAMPTAGRHQVLAAAWVPLLFPACCPPMWMPWFSPTPPAVSCVCR